MRKTIIGLLLLLLTFCLLGCGSELMTAEELRELYPTVSTGGLGSYKPAKFENLIDRDRTVCVVEATGEIESFMVTDIPYERIGCVVTEVLLGDLKKGDEISLYYSDICSEHFRILEKGVPLCVMIRNDGDYEGWVSSSNFSFYVSETKQLVPLDASKFEEDITGMTVDAFKEKVHELYALKEEAVTE